MLNLDPYFIVSLLVTIVLMSLFVSRTIFSILDYTHIVSEFTVYHSLSLTNKDLFEALKDQGVIPVSSSLLKKRKSLAIDITCSVLTMFVGSLSIFINL